MLRKRRSTDRVKVTFVLPAQLEAEQICVLGDFNEWQADTPMRRYRDRSWRCSVELEPGREYEFRYLRDGQEWLNDPEPDRTAPNPYGGENSVLLV